LPRLITKTTKRCLTGCGPHCKPALVPLPRWRDPGCHGASQVSATTTAPVTIIGGRGPLSRRPGRCRRMEALSKKTLAGGLTLPLDWPRPSRTRRAAGQIRGHPRPGGCFRHLCLVRPLVASTKAPPCPSLPCVVSPASGSHGGPAAERLTTIFSAQIGIGPADRVGRRECHPHHRVALWSSRPTVRLGRAGHPAAALRFRAFMMTSVRLLVYGFLGTPRARCGNPRAVGTRIRAVCPGGERLGIFISPGFVRPSFEKLRGRTEALPDRWSQDGRRRGTRVCTGVEPRGRVHPRIGLTVFEADIADLDGSWS